MKALRTFDLDKAEVRVPGSKSLTHRALIIAALAHGESRLKDPLICEDTLCTMDGLRALGTRIKCEKGLVRVQGGGGGFPCAPDPVTINLGESGTSFRLLMPVAALSNVTLRLTGAGRMLKRPVGPLVDSLRRLGADISCVDEEGCPPVLVRGNGIKGGSVLIPGGVSSQFVSALLISGPYAESGIHIEVEGGLISRPYVDITIDVMERFGIKVEQRGNSCFRVPSGQGYMAREVAIDGDASSASYFWAAAAVSGGMVVTENIEAGKTSQGDIGFLDILEKMGCIVEREGKSVSVRGGSLTGIEIDMSLMPDMVPTLAAVALFARGRTVIYNVPHLRNKECDRLSAISSQWKMLGAEVEELESGLIIKGGGDLKGRRVDPHEDHRIAMSLAVIGSRVPGILLENEMTVAKSFPAFWDLWDSMGD